MAYSTVSTLVTRALDNMSRASTVTTRSGTSLADRSLDWVNTTLTTMSNYHTFKELKRLYSMTTVADSKIYGLPSACGDILSMRLIDGLNSRKLINLATRHTDKYAPNPDDDTTGHPIYYNPFGKTFELYPIPDDAYQVLLRSADTPATVTALTDTLDYESDKDPIIVAGTTAEGFRYLQMYEDAAYWDKEFAKLLKLAKDSDTEEPDWSPMGIGFSSDPTEYMPSEYWNSPWVRVR